MDVAPLIVGDTEVCEALRTSGARDFGLGGEVEWLEQLVKISETEELVEREKKIDRLRWNWMEETTSSTISQWNVCSCSCYSSK